MTAHVAVEREDEVVYVGTRGPSGPRVEALEGGRRRPIGPRRRYPSAGFEWGYRGVGPVNTAHAILADALGREPFLHESRRFAWHVVSRLPREGFRLERARVRAWAAQRLDPVA